MDTEDLDSVIRASLSSLVEDLFGTDWFGEEREVVSLYCFGHLLKHCRSGIFLYDPAQIGIEVGVPQVPEQTILSGRRSAKKRVCKDIVIWPKPRMTVWDSARQKVVRPICVIEWTHNENAIKDSDLKWLEAFSKRSGDFVGFAVCTNRTERRRFRLSCTRFFRGTADDRWMHLE
jgi:hypothetical protein